MIKLFDFKARKCMIKSMTSNIICLKVREHMIMFSVIIYFIKVKTREWIIIYNVIKNYYHKIWRTYDNNSCHQTLVTKECTIMSKVIKYYHKNWRTYDNIRCYWTLLTYKVENVLFCPMSSNIMISKTGEHMIIFNVIKH